MGETAFWILSVSSLCDQFWFIKRPNNLVAENYHVDQTLSSKYFLQWQHLEKLSLWLYSCLLLCDIDMIDLSFFLEVLSSKIVQCKCANCWFLWKVCDVAVNHIPKETQYQWLLWFMCVLRLGLCPHFATSVPHWIRLWVQYSFQRTSQPQDQNPPSVLLHVCGVLMPFPTFWCCFYSQRLLRICK